MLLELGLEGILAERGMVALPTKIELATEDDVKAAARDGEQGSAGGAKRRGEGILVQRSANRARPPGQLTAAPVPM